MRAQDLLYGQGLPLPFPTAKGLMAPSSNITSWKGLYTNFVTCQTIFRFGLYGEFRTDSAGDGVFHRMSLLNFEQDRFRGGTQLDRNG